jgi:hypothetical protein
VSAKGSAARIDRAGIGAAYGLMEHTVDVLVRLLNFPPPVAEDQWDAARVDHWFRTNRPQFWPAKAPVPDALEEAAGRVDETGAGTAAPDAVDQGEPLLGVTGLARRYKVSASAVSAWRKARGAAAFPAQSEPGKWRPRDVDSWVQEHRSHVWAELTGAGPTVVIAPPDGHPRDLYGIGGYGEILGNATRGRPLSRTTMLSYKSQGHLPPPDRRPGDRKKPEVFEPMWYLETIREHVYARRGPGRTRAGRARRARKR